MAPGSSCPTLPWGRWSSPGSVPAPRSASTSWLHFSGLTGRTQTWYVGMDLQRVPLKAKALAVPCSAGPSEMWDVLVSLQSRIDVYMGHIPAGSSVQNIIHWLQVNLPSPTECPCSLVGSLLCCWLPGTPWPGPWWVLFPPLPKMLGRLWSQRGGCVMELRALQPQQEHSRALVSNQLQPCSPSAISGQNSGRGASGQQPIKLITDKADYFSFFPSWA